MGKTKKMNLRILLVAQGQRTGLLSLRRVRHRIRAPEQGALGEPAKETYEHSQKMREYGLQLSRS
jgi:hypothetical protein